MKKLTLIFMAFIFIFALSCENPIKTEMISKAKFDEIQNEKLEGTFTVWAPQGKPIFIKFAKDITPEEAVTVQANTKNWHISSYDATWRFSANSGTTGVAYGSRGDSEVKVYELKEGETFESITSINHTGFSKVYKDEVFSVNGQNQNLNYALTKDIANDSETTPSPTYLFKFDGSGMGTGKPVYFPGDRFIFLISDGNGQNWVKIQPIEISTDNPGSMSFTKRKYVFKYAMANNSGNFPTE